MAWQSSSENADHSVTALSGQRVSHPLDLCLRKHADLLNFSIAGKLPCRFAGTSWQACGLGCGAKQLPAQNSWSAQGSQRLRMARRHMASAKASNRLLRPLDASDRRGRIQTAWRPALEPLAYTCADWTALFACRGTVSGTPLRLHRLLPLREGRRKSRFTARR